MVGHGIEIGHMRQVFGSREQDQRQVQASHEQAGARVPAQRFAGWHHVAPRGGHGNRNARTVPIVLWA
eukprot:11174331-Lingulodinium_polyedra.AAC.1